MQRTPLSLASPYSANGLQNAPKRDSDNDRRHGATLPRSSSLASHLPASLGIGTPQNAVTPLSERLKLSKSSASSSSSSSSLVRSTSSADGLQFSNAAAASGRDGSESSSRPSLPSWGSSGSTSFAQTPRGLSTSSSTGSFGSTSSSASSRNFLVPIGATGARQRLSIANASQQRKVSASDDGTWSADSPTGLVGAQSQPHQQRNGLGLNRSQSDMHSLKVQQRTSSQGLIRSPTMDALAPASRTADIAASETSTTPTTDPAEQVQQAALKRLSSQRMLPSPRERNFSDSVPTRYSSGRPSPFTSGPPTPEREQAPPAVAAMPSATWRRTEPVTTSSQPPVQPPAAVTVPDRTASSLDPSAFQGAGAAASLANTVPRRPELQPRGDIHDVGDNDTITSTPLTLAETYKRAMLEREAERAKSMPRPHLPSSTVSSQTSAPILDLHLPSSSLFASSDAPQTRQTFAPHPSSSTHASREDESTNARTPARTDGPGSDLKSQPTPLPRRVPRSTRTPPAQGAVDSPDVLKSQNGASVTADNLPSPDRASANGTLVNGVTDLSARRPQGQSLAGSYLALGDDDDDRSDAQSKTTPKQETITLRAARQQAQRAVASTPVKAATPAAQPPRTPPSDKSFVEFSTPPEEDLTTPKAEAPPSDFAPPPSSNPQASRDAVTANVADVDRPGMSRDPSLKTLQPPPHKLEAQPAPREEAALQAGAVAAATTSPIVPTQSTFSNPNPFKAASPVINGERTVQPPDETADAARWRRGQEALATFSPLQQSRFSEASTDLSDSRAPTRNEDRWSRRASSVSSNDALEDEPSDAQMLPASAWHEVENALRRFRDKASGGMAAERGNLLRAILLPFLALEAETVTVDVIGYGLYVHGKARRALFFDWIRSLLLELQHVQTSADRGALLESIACIIESRNFSASILSTDPEDEARFSSVFGHILSYAIGELNKKGVYQNTLIFSGRLLAVAFFRVNGVASKLLRALPVNRFALERVAREFDWHKRRPTDFTRFANRFPPSLRQLCYKDSRDYLKMLDSESANVNGSQGPEDDRYLVCQPEVEVEMSGNWLRRWQSDDSELFFSFCRSYHRQLAGLFASTKSLESVSKYFFGGPGYAHLATCVHQKCLALVHRVILSVTTLSSQKNFNPAGETANVLSGSTAGKPRILEAANRRCTAIVVDIVRAPAGTNMIFAPMLGLHVKALVKRTSLYDVQGVFCLLDWLDGVLSHMDSNDLINEGLIDVSFVITTIGMLLENADHALALMRTIAFCYANFGVLTATAENRVHFCEQILLKPSVFHKLFLSWSFTIRAYYLHLLVFRLARIADFPTPKDDPAGKSAIRVVQLFNQRLEALRKRHDMLSPEIESSSDGTKSDDGTKSGRSGSSTFVSTIKRTSSEGTSVETSSVDGRVKAEKIMPMTAVAPAVASPPTKAADGKKPGHSKTKSWLKAFRGAGKGDGKGSGGNSPRQSQAFAPTHGKMGSTESDDDNKTIGSSRTTPRTSFDSVSSDAMSDVSTLAGSVRGGKSGRRGSGSGGYEFDIKEQQRSQQQQQQAGRSSSSSAQAVTNGSSSTSTVAPPLSPTHDAGIAKDTVFDLQNTHAQLPTPGRTPPSPRISRAFSRRASILPAHASELVAGLSAEPVPPLPDLPAEHFGLGLTGVHGDSAAEVYSESLHIYAVQGLREYEQTVQEHDDFFASLGADQSTQVPRLPVNWPAMWSSTGE